MSRKRVSAAVRQGRKACWEEFEPLWKPAPHIHPKPDTALERADCQAAAKRTAFAWLAAQLHCAAFSSFDDIDDVALLRRAWAVMWNATLNDVRAWADAMEAGTPAAAARTIAARDREAAHQEEHGWVGDVAAMSKALRNAPRQARHINRFKGRV